MNQGPVSSKKFLGQILKVSKDIFWDVRKSVSSRRPKIVLRLKCAFHQKCPTFYYALVHVQGHKIIMCFITCELIIAV